jgi:hypothetical protein
MKSFDRPRSQAIKTQKLAGPLDESSFSMMNIDLKFTLDRADMAARNCQSFLAGNGGDISIDKKFEESWMDGVGMKVLRGIISVNLH